MNDIKDDEMKLSFKDSMKNSMKMSMKPFKRNTFGDSIRKVNNKKSKDQEEEQKEILSFPEKKQLEAELILWKERAGAADAERIVSELNKQVGL